MGGFQAQQNQRRALQTVHQDVVVLAAFIEGFMAMSRMARLKWLLFGTIDRQAFLRRFQEQQRAAAKQQEPKAL